MDPYAHLQHMETVKHFHMFDMDVGTILNESTASTIGSYYQSL